MPRFAANLSMLFTELPFLDRFEAAASAGFQAGPYMATYYASKAFVVMFSEALWETYDHRVEGRLVTFGSPDGDALEGGGRAGRGRRPRRTGSA